MRSIISSVLVLIIAGAYASVSGLLSGADLMDFPAGVWIVFSTFWIGVLPVTIFLDWRFRRRRAQALIVFFSSVLSAFLIVLFMYFGGYFADSNLQEFSVFILWLSILFFIIFQFSNVMASKSAR